MPSRPSARDRQGPRIGNLRAPAFDGRGPIECDFTFAARGGRVASLDAELATVLGVVRQSIPAAVAGMEGARGAGRLGLDLAVLPAGPSELTLAIVDEDGLRGPPVSAAFEVTGSGGAGPVLVAVKQLSARITRPRQENIVLARMAVEGKAGEHEIAAVWVSVRPPGGTATASAAAYADSDRDGPLEVALATFRSDDELGEYAASVTFVDAAGNVSESLETAVELVSEGGAPGPSIDGFSPEAAQAGDEVVVEGSGLDAEGLEVEVAGVAAPVLSANGKSMRIRMPEVDRPGRIAVAGAAGAALSAQELSPRTQVRILPEEIRVPEGVPIALTAIVTGTTDGRVEWRAEASGGKPGKISPEGVYTPPLGREKGAVTISAVSSADRSASARARIRVIPHPSARGPLPLGPLGGTVRSEDDRCILTLPRKALRELATIGVETVPIDSEDAPPGQIVVAAARISGGVSLSVPGELTLPLSIPLDVAAEVGVQVRDDLGDPWLDVPDLASVIPGSEALKLRLESLPVHVRVTLHYTPPVPSFLPSITGMSPSALNEGETAAVLVTGKNFVPGVTYVTVLKPAGGTEQRVDVRQIFVTADGTKLGVTLKAGVMTDLAEGDTRHLRLRLTTPAGSAERALDILGHDELDFAGNALPLAQSRTFSRIRVGVGGVLRIAHTEPPLSIAAYETIVVGADSPGQGRALVEVVTGSGTPGTLGDAGGGGGAGGAPTAFPGVAGGGGRGGPGGFSSSGGGTPGSSGSGPIHQVPGAGGGGGFGGFGYGRDGASGRAAAMPGFPSANFVPPLVRGAGGGGGGGGGGEGVVFKSTAGGGGGGGAGGGALELAAGEEIRIRGRVAANAGDGGDGAFPFAVGNPPSAPTFHAGCGGGGGAGSGGTIFLRGLRLLDGEVLAVGGMDGRAARFSNVVMPPPVTLTELQRLLANPHSGLIQIDGSVTPGAVVAPGAFLAPDLDYRPELVTGSPQITVSGQSAGSLRVRNSSGEQFLPVPAPFAVTVPLAPGFNDLDGVVAGGGGVPGDPFFILTQSHPVRMRRVLFLQGAATGFGFACAISPPTPTVVTERTVKLTATVTGTTLSAVTWSVDGVAANGVVDQQGTYRAPCSVPAGPVIVRASSAFDPTKSGIATVTVIAGITLTAQATVGTPADPAVPSANVGQQIAIAIPAAVSAQTHQDFAVGQNIEFGTIQRDATGVCKPGTTAVAGTVAVGMKSLHVAVPSCAASDQQVKVTGHGCARLQVVPRITALDRSSSLGQGMAVNGTGYACGATDVYFGSTKVAAAQLLSVTCTVILLGTRPAPGEHVTVRTAGGTSNAVT